MAASSWRRGPVGSSGRARSTTRRCAGGGGGAQRLVFATSDGAEHDYPGHPECAARVQAATEALLDDVSLRDAGGVRLLEAWDPATLEGAAAAGHTPSFLKSLEFMARTRAPLTLDDSPTYLMPGSIDVALNGLGAATALVDATVTASASGSPATGFALVRPPGHHARPKGAMGFCLLGTAAAAVRHAQAAHGLERVMVIDFDVHHGNGTSDIFEQDPNVLFVSVHQSGSFPGTGKLADVGKGDGEGATVNVPLPAGSGDAEAREAFERVVMPAAERFRPEMVVVSAGYDAHWRDQLASLNYTGATFHALTSYLQEFADRACAGRCVFVLEGGYDLDGLSEGVLESARAVAGLASADTFDASLLPDAPADAARRAIDEAVAIHGL